MKKIKIIVGITAIATLTAATVFAANDGIKKVVNFKSIKLNKKIEEKKLTPEETEKDKVIKKAEKLFPNKSFTKDCFKVKQTKYESANVDEIHYYNDDIIIKLDGKTKKFLGATNNKTTFTKCTMNENEVKNVLNEIYNSLEIENKEQYTLDEVIKFDDEIYNAVYTKKYDGLKNVGEAIKIAFAPMDKEIVVMNIREVPFDNNEVKIQEKDVIKYAKEKIIELGNKKIVNINLQIVNPNYQFERKIQGEGYQTINKMRKAYVVTLEGGSQIYVDATFGEIIGGQVAKGVVK